MTDFLVLLGFLLALAGLAVMLFFILSMFSFLLGAPFVPASARVARR